MPKFNNTQGKMLIRFVICMDPTIELPKQTRGGYGIMIKIVFVSGLIGTHAHTPCYEQASFASATAKITFWRKQSFSNKEI